MQTQRSRSIRAPARSSLPFPFTLAPLALVLALAGCGGGGGGSSGGGSSDFASTVTGATGNTPDTRRVAGEAAAATPKEGSVTQSSNVDSSTVTEDQLEATADYTNGALRVSVTNQRSGSWGTVSTNDLLIRSNNDLVGAHTGDIYQQRTFGKRVDNGVLLVDIYTDRVDAADTDYLAGGVWVLAPDDAASADDLEIGAFVDSPMTPTPSAYLRTAATVEYEGDATGLYLGVSDGDEFTGEFEANIDLTASFGVTPTITGTVSNFMDIDFTRTTPAAIDEGIPTLTLEPASIADAPGGFFSGDTSAPAEVDSVDDQISGKWGGQFFGTEAQRVGGTFGGHTSNEDDSLVFVGAFAAKKK